MSLTIEDKDRHEGLRSDGEWRPFTILAAGGIRRSVYLPDGEYDVQVSLHGGLAIPPKSQLELRLQRYPSKDSTAWTRTDVRDGVDPLVWFFTFSGKLVFGDSDNPAVARRMGIDYRLIGGGVFRTHLIIKPMPL